MTDNSQENSRNTIPFKRSLASPPPSEAIVPPQSSTPPVPWHVLLEVGTEPISFVKLEIVDQLIIGRSDAVKGQLPRLDLTPFGAQAAGVSRLHAAIHAGPNELYIRDLESTNGTILNGLALQANRLFRLQDDDEIKLGRLRLRLTIVHSARKQATNQS